MAEEVQHTRRGFLFGRLKTAVASVQSEVAAVASATPAPTPEAETATAQLAHIGERCLALQQVVCRTCGELCDTGAIRFVMQAGRVAQPEVQTERCTGCGDCIADCPTQALALVPVLPAMPAVPVAPVVAASPAVSIPVPLSGTLSPAV